MRRLSCSIIFLFLLFSSSFGEIYHSDPVGLRKEIDNAGSGYVFCYFKFLLTEDIKSGKYKEIENDPSRNQPMFLIICESSFLDSYMEMGVQCKDQLPKIIALNDDNKEKYSVTLNPGEFRFFLAKANSVERTQVQREGCLVFVKQAAIWVIVQATFALFL